MFLEKTGWIYNSDPANSYSRFESISTKQKNAFQRFYFGGKRWIRTIEDIVDGFTVRCIWPLCNLPKKMELVIGIEPTTCWLQVSCSTIEPHQHTIGALRWNRTTDTRIFSPLLYRLSYQGELSFYSLRNWRLGWGSNPRPPAWQAGVLTNWTTEPQKTVFSLVCHIKREV